MTLVQLGLIVFIPGVTQIALALAPADHVVRLGSGRVDAQV